MKRLFIILVFLYSAKAIAGERRCYAYFDPKPSSWSLGFRMQKAMGFYYTGGITGEYSSTRLLNNKLSLGANLTSSIIGNGLRKNAIRTYEFDVSAIKYFRESKKLQPVTRINIGYMYAAYGKDFLEKIPNQSMLCSIEFAAALNINPKLKPTLGFGYNVITGNGSKGLATVFPLYAQFSILYRL